MSEKEGASSMSASKSDLEKVLDFANFGRAEISGSRIKFSQGVDEITVAKGNDGKWRYTYQATYGNGSFVWSGDVKDPYAGGAYDASGFVIKDEGLIKFLNEKIGKAK